METEKREFRRWILSSIDLDQAIEWANIILENQLYEEGGEEAQTISRGLQTSMVVAYSRPFSGNYDREHTTGRLNDEFLEVYDDDEKALHNRIIRLRHQVFAHSDSEVRGLEVNVTLFVDVTLAIPVSHNPHVSMTREELERFRKMARKLQSRISKEMVKIQEKFTPGQRF